MYLSGLSAAWKAGASGCEPTRYTQPRRRPYQETPRTDPHTSTDSIDVSAVRWKWSDGKHRVWPDPTRRDFITRLATRRARSVVSEPSTHRHWGDTNVNSALIDRIEKQRGLLAVSGWRRRSGDDCKQPRGDLAADETKDSPGKRS